MKLILYCQTLLPDLYAMYVQAVDLRKVITIQLDHRYHTRVVEIKVDLQPMTGAT